VLIDSGHNPVEARKLMEVVKKLTHAGAVLIDRATS